MDLDEPNEWMELFRLLHWGAGKTDPFPRESKTYMGIEMPIVKEDALPDAGKHPLMIRPVYEEILQKLEENLKAEKPMGICVFGHPGTGKSTSLWYLLIHMLRKWQMVLWVESSVKNMILFTEHFSPIAACMSKRFGHPNHVVLATSPQITQFRPFFNSGVRSITVDFCSRRESKWLQQASPSKWTKPPGYHDVLTMYDYIGPSLHTLRFEEVKIGQGTTVEEDFEVYAQPLRKLVETTDSELWVVKSKCDLEFSALPTLVEPRNYHRIFRVSPIDAPGSDTRFFWEPRFTVHLATPFIARLFFSTIRYRTFVEQLRYAARFPKVSAVRALLFEHSSIRFLSWSDDPSPVVMMPGVEDFEIPGRLRTAHDLLELKPGSPPTPEVLHVAQVGSATLDALYEAEDGTKYLFQMTIAKSHGISVKGLNQVMACYTTPTETASLGDFVLVFVVPDEETREKYLTKYADGQKFVVGDETQTLQVGVLVIDTGKIETLEELTIEQWQSSLVW